MSPALQLTLPPASPSFPQLPPASPSLQLKLKCPVSASGSAPHRLLACLQLTQNGKTLLTTVEDVMLPIARSQKLSIGYMFTDNSAATGAVQAGAVQCMQGHYLFTKKEQPEASGLTV